MVHNDQWCICDAVVHASNQSVSIDDARLLWWFRWTGGSSGSSLRSRNALRRCTDQFYRNMERPNETYYYSLHHYGPDDRCKRIGSKRWSRVLVLTYLECRSRLCNAIFQYTADANDPAEL